MFLHIDIQNQRNVLDVFCPTSCLVTHIFKQTSFHEKVMQYIGSNVLVKNSVLESYIGNYAFQLCKLLVAVDKAS